MLRRYPEAMQLLEDKKINTPKKWVQAIKDWVARNTPSSTENKFPFDEKLMVIGGDTAYIFDKRGNVQSVSVIERIDCNDKEG